MVDMSNPYEITSDYPLPKVSYNNKKGKKNGMEADPHSRKWRTLKGRSKAAKAILLLEVGQSFFWPVNSRQTGSRIQDVRRAYPNRFYTVRARIENGIKGVRVWRGEDRS